MQQAAEAQGKTPQAYCDELAIWKVLAAKLGLSIDFVRTTEARHQQVVQAIFTKLQANGFFYKASHKGFYSVREETFLTEKWTVCPMAIFQVIRRSGRVGRGRISISN